MDKSLLFLCPALLLTLGCAGRAIIPTTPALATEPAAAERVAASQRAHGGERFQQLRNLMVEYDGTWGAFGPRFQPVLVDRDYRKSSRETLDLRRREIVQIHSGPGGTKEVRRTPDSIQVRYDGIPSTDDEQRRAAALVADAYQMFLLGPFYFDRAGVTLRAAGRGAVGDRAVDQVLAILRPGFGFAEEDRVLLSIDRETDRLLRVRMTLNGLASTRGAEVDVTFSGFEEIDGVLWPRRFVERIRAPFDLHAHTWELLQLEAR